MILEMVSGEPFSTQGDIASRVTELWQGAGDRADIRDVIERALVENLECLSASIEEMKEVVGKLIYQGAYAPSTFSSLLQCTRCTAARTRNSVAG